MSVVVDEESGRAVVRDGVLTIRIAVAALPVALKGAGDLGAVEGAWKVTDPDAFAQEVVSALNHEDEQGTTLVHRMFDAAFDAVIESGGEGFEEAPGDEEG